MSDIKFFTPINYNTPNKSIFSKTLEKVDNYFYFGGKKVYVIKSGTKNSKIIFKNEKVSTNSKELIKLASYLTVIIPIIMLGVKAALRFGLHSKHFLFRHKYKVIDPQAKLEKGLDVSKDTVVTIQKLWSKIYTNDTDIKWLSKGNWKVFKLKKNPNLVFKYGGRYGISTEDRFQSMIKAKEVCLTYELGLLKIPQAKKIEIDVGGKKISLIVEKAFDIDSDESKQEEHFYTFSEQLEETARQLATFVAKTGFNDVTPRNIPIINESEHYTGNRKIALIDIEHMQSVVKGFTGGGNGSCGLIRCMANKKLIDIVINEASRQKVAFTDDEKKTKDRRLQEIKEYELLQKFYKEKEIKGGEIIDVDFGSLGLDLVEKDTVSEPETFEKDGEIWVKVNKFRNVEYSMKAVAKAVVQEINRILMQQAKTNGSIKGKRYILLNTNRGPLLKYTSFGQKNIITCDEDEKKLWLHRIIQALIDKDYIFKLEKVDGHGYFIQA